MGQGFSLPLSDRGYSNSPCTSLHHMTMAGYNPTFRTHTYVLCSILKIDASLLSTRWYAILHCNDTRVAVFDGIQSHTTIRPSSVAVSSNGPEQGGILSFLSMARCKIRKERKKVLIFPSRSLHMKADYSGTDM